MLKIARLVVILFICTLSLRALAFDQASTLTALRLSYSITGGTMPTSDPLFTTMVSQVAAGNIKGAATTAATSKYFTNYLARRLALQMQSPALDATVTTDSDSTAFLIAHFTGAAGNAPSLSTIWSENQMYVLNVPINGVNTPTHVINVPGATGFAIQLTQIDWSTQLLPAGPQMVTAAATAVNGSTPTLTLLPQKHVGGYTTSSTTLNFVDDKSFASYGATVGTNLRFIEGIWEIATGLSLVDAEDTNYATTDLALAQAVPRFVPENNPNFLVGQGQSACIACHGGGLSSMKHGYATVANVFDYRGYGGFVYQDPTTVTTANKKSLGSTPDNRAATLACNLVTNPSIPCNGDSPDVDPNQGWDLSSWQANGLLARMGWTGPVAGQGLNQLGVAIGQASITYEFFVKRVIGEVCPTGAFTDADVKSIANAANPYATTPGTDDLRTIVALVASNSSCQ